MASLLRQIVAGPRSRHPEAGLDLCYVTDNIIVTSGPSSTYPQRAYRNPTDALVRWLDKQHGSNWAIWEFRAEGTGYPDSEVYGRIRHYPWPDHHPPPFALIPNIMASMRNWLRRREEADTGFREFGADGRELSRVVVVHCKAGKGRSGTVACSYLVSEDGWTVADALRRFTGRRMRAGFGDGVSIPSQLRWVRYVERWTRTGKVYVERPVEVLEVHAWGLREGVKVSVEGFVDGGRTIKTFHVFDKKERMIVAGAGDGEVNSPLAPGSAADVTSPAVDPGLPGKKEEKDGLAAVDASSPAPASPSEPQLVHVPTSPNHSDPTLDSLPRQDSGGTTKNYAVGYEPGGKAVIFKPRSRVVLPTSDLCIDLERRNRATYGWTLVTSVAHVWFNAYFEGLGDPDPDSDAEHAAEAAESGTFEVRWDAMDGIKGSSRKGTRALDRLAVVWRVLDAHKQEVRQPEPGEQVPEMPPAKWQGDNPVKEGEAEKKRVLGLRAETPPVGSAAISRASSVRSGGGGGGEGRDSDYEDSIKGVRCEFIERERSRERQSSEAKGGSEREDDSEAQGGGKANGRVGFGTVAGIISGVKGLKTEDLPGGKSEEELSSPKERQPGKLVRATHVMR